MYSEDDLLPLSGLQHLVFCERQWRLIHIEQVWAENRLTAEGRVLHDRAHEAGSESRPGLRIARGLRLRSLRLGISGQADVVEFRAAPNGVALPGEDGFWRALPVEYKRGRSKRDHCDLTGEASGRDPCTSAGGRSGIIATRFSCALKRCAWKRCLDRWSRKGRSFTAHHGGGRTWFSLRRCGPKRRRSRRACTNCIALALRPAPCIPRSATSARCWVPACPRRLAAGGRWN